MSKSLSIYGATGFIGSRFCELSPHTCLKIPREDRKPQSDHLVYFISTTHNYHIFDDPFLDVNTNITTLLQTLTQLTPDQHKITFISSWFVYGDCPLPATEDNHCNPKGFYAITKRTAEQLLISYCQTKGIDYQILRLCNVYGPGDKGISAKKNALQYLIEEMKQDKPISLYHGGHFTRDYIHVDDVCRAINLCLDAWPQQKIINIGSGTATSFLDVMELARKNLNSKSEFTATEPPEFHKQVQVKDFVMDVSVLQSLGFKPKITLKEGITSLCHKT